jgi:glycosyltransferase involved in cell wall biosynthesis/ubiquinone/menaquinone biosynthesis C-methylase UbiE
MKITEVDDRKAAGGSLAGRTPGVGRTDAPRILRYVCVGFGPLRTGVLWDDRLAALTERHRLRLELPAWCEAADVMQRVEAGETAGVILVLEAGCLYREMLAVCRQVLASGRRLFAYWPAEQAIECVDDERLASYHRHWLLLQFHKRWVPFRRKAGPVLNRVNPLPRLARWLRRGQPPAPPAPDRKAAALPAQYAPIMADLDRLVREAEPVEVAWLKDVPGPECPIPGNGVYLRTDFWAPITSGGSYGHTCYVAKSLKKLTEHLYCLMPHRYRLIDDFSLGIRQLVLDVPSASCNEDDLARATEHYYKSLKPLLELLQPAYLYERLCLGNYAGAKLARKLGIPYVVEYNGSEISMRRSFDGQGYELEALYLQAEMAAFRQATLITVVSEPVKEDLVQRGVDPHKILVNPNACDPDDYRPPDVEEWRRLRGELGWDDSHRVVGFTGTFGGWHGIDVLAEALPLICREAPEVRFLLIGDGNRKGLIDDAIARHGLQGQVHCTGRIEQAEARRLLGACDLFVSPHNRQMDCGRFFGSPTKVFEYMALAGGIVASDLDQIGEVLSPALRVSDFFGGRPALGEQRAVLCRPGDVDDFVQGVLALVRDRETCTALGWNARRALVEHHSWDRHVRNLWEFQRRRMRKPPVTEAAGPAEKNGTPLQRIRTGDDYKDEVQNQWNENPCGSQYVKEARPHTLDWFLEVEAYRYGSYAPWMPRTMEFAHFAGKDVLEIGGGLGTDLVQFAKHGARVTDLDLSAGHLALAQENFRLRGLSGRFLHHDGERLPFPDGSFDLVYSNGVIHHTPNAQQVINEMHRVLRPGGRAIVMVYAENSLHYWGRLVWGMGLNGGQLAQGSMGDLMSRSVEITENDARPLVKVYTRRRLRRMFGAFREVRIVQRQLTAPELPGWLRWMPLGLAGRLMGWNLIVKATKSS